MSTTFWKALPMPETTRELLTSGGWKELAFGPFRDQVTIHWNRPFEDDQPGVALLKFEAGGVIITTKLSFRHGLASSATPS